MSGTTGFKFGRMTNVTMKDCGSIGHDTGFDVGIAEGCHFERNISLSAEAHQKLEQTYQYIIANKSSVIAESSEKTYQGLLEAVKNLSTPSPFDIMEKLASLGANTLTIWPTLESLIKHCIELLK